MARQHWRVTAIVVLAISVLLLTVSTVSAYPTGDEPWWWHHGGGETPPPDIPAGVSEGNYTTDCPTARYYAWQNASNSFDARSRGDLAAALYWQTPYTAGSTAWIGTGRYREEISHLGDWPVQSLPTGNATIKDVWLVARLSTLLSGTTNSIYLQYSLNGMGASAVWYPNLTVIMPTNPVVYSAAYQILAVNVTNTSIAAGGAGQNWTPQLLISSDFCVRVVLDFPTYYEKRVFVDYVGLKYNWTIDFSANPNPKPYWDYPNSTLPHISYASFIIGSMGMIGFGGMVLTPVALIVVGRRSDNKGMVLAKGIALFVLCFGLFLIGTGV